MDKLIITTIQTDLHWENKVANLDMMRTKIMGIKEKTNIVVLPEMFSTGFTMKPELLAEKMGGETIAWMRNIAREKGINKETMSPARFSGERINLNALRRKLHLLHCKIYFPELPLWELALKAGISKRYQDLNAVNKKHGKSFTQDDIDILNIIVSRALANAQYICENAVRDKFPSMEKVLTPKYDWKLLKSRVRKAWPNLEY